MADLWYYTSEGKQMEPVTNAELRQLAGSGFLRPTDMVWKEGMANWVKASAVNGLFPAPAAGSRSAPASTSGSSARVAAAAPAPRPAAKPERRRPEREEREERDDRDEDDDEPRTRRRRRRPASSGSGMIIGLVVGGVVVVLLLLGLTLFFVFRGGGPGAANVAGYSVDLGPRMFNTRDFEFKANTRYEIRVTSDRRTDVDLFIENMNGQMLMADTTIGPNSFLSWVPPAAGNYRVKVMNLDPGRQNRSHIAINERGAGAPMPGPGPFGIQPVPPPMGGVPINVGGMRQQVLPRLNEDQDWETTVTYPAAKAVVVTINTIQQQTDVDLFIEEVGGAQIGFDVGLSANCRVQFNAQAGRTYRFRVHNLGPGGAQSTISYTPP